MIAPESMQFLSEVAKTTSQLLLHELEKKDPDTERISLLTKTLHENSQKMWDSVAKLELPESDL